MGEHTEVYAWGCNEDGQLGLGQNGNKRQYQLPMICSFNVQLTYVACGKDHSAIIAANGHLYTMGSNQWGKLGVKGPNCTSPQLVEQLTNYKISGVSCGFNHTACVTNEGLAFAWGDNSHGQLGCRGRKGDILQIPLPEIEQISCGNYHTLALTGHGEVLSFGFGEQGQLGVGKMAKSSEPMSLKIAPMKQVVGGNNFSMFLGQDGTAYACGEQYGAHPNKIGLKYKFVKLGAKQGAAGLTNKGDLIIFESDHIINGIVDFSIGNKFGIAIGQQQCYSWGVNNMGQLAQNSNIPQSQPTPLDSLFGRNIIGISAGESHVIALGNGSKLQRTASQTQSNATIKSKVGEDKKDDMRSRSNYSERMHSDISEQASIINKLQKQLSDKDKQIQALKLSHQQQVEQLQQEINQLHSELKEKDEQIEQMDKTIEQLSKKQDKPMSVLQCVVKCPEETLFENNVAISPIRQNRQKYETLEDSLQKDGHFKTNNDDRTKYQSHENFKKLLDIENRPTSQIRNRGDETNKSNINTIKSRLTDLQRNKSALENRMKQFEDRLREKKQYQI